jgi:hypothetical protein
VIKVTFVPVDEDRIVDATADAPGVQAAIHDMAMKVAGRATANISIHGVHGDRSGADRNEVQSEIGVTSLEEFVRVKYASGTVIPVVLAVSDHPGSQRWEYGAGKRTPKTMFMRRALEASGGTLWRKSVATGGKL